MKLLNIISSPRAEKSRTLQVSAEFLNTIKEKYPEVLIQDLDLFRTKLPEVFGGPIDAKYAFMSGEMPDKEALKSWDEISRFATEFVEADIYVISAPMWNFSIPYKLKQYIDIIMQAGILFSFTEKGVVGLAKNKKMICITSRGNDYSVGSPVNQFDLLEPYLRSIFGFVGITDVSFINAQPMDFTTDITEASLEKAKDEARLLASNFKMNYSVHLNN
ncbi:MAG: NAD(P)H-dependent oxidoreductase [Lentimicrobiaceae bacterium]|jgi:FMN-dependent NADH-azoreductase